MLAERILFFLLYMIMTFVFSGCVSFQRSPDSGYYNGSSKSTKSGWKKVSNIYDNLPKNEIENSQSYDPKLRLKQLENSLSSDREVAQYSRILPWLKNNEEKIQFLELPGYEARQTWINENEFYGRVNRINSQLQELVDNQDIALGMPEALVKKSWGDPDSVEVSGSPQFRNFKWRYKKFVPTQDGYKSERKIVYFEGGKVAGWEKE